MSATAPTVEGASRSATDESGRPAGLGPFRLAVELIRYRPGRFGVVAACWTVIHGSPLVFGLLAGRVFETLAEVAAVGSAGDELGGAGRSTVWWWVVAFAVAAVLRNALIWFGEVAWIGYWHEQNLQLRRNLLAWLLRAVGARLMPKSPGAAVSTFREDTEDLVEWVETYVDAGGIGLFVFGSVAVMASIDWALTAVLTVPLFGIVAVSRAMGPRIRDRRRIMRRSTEEVTGLVGEVFGAVQSIKLAAAEDRVLAEFARRNEVRRQAALRDVVITELLFSINRNMSVVTVAVVLLALASGGPLGRELSVGELVVFLVYLPRLTNNLAYVGHMMAQHRRSGVAYERMRDLTVDAPDAALLDRTRVAIDPGSGPGREASGPGPAARPVDGVSRLERCVVEGLSFHHRPVGHDGAAPGIDDVSFELERGSFTVLVGPMGAGKTTILRALLGLVPAGGTLRWNGAVVADRASFLVPPRSAYTPQLPRLFSDSLAANIAFREHPAPGSSRSRSEAGAIGVEQAARLAVLDRDLDELPHGLDTVVGARGVKLSGGQVQRAAVARMLITGADLLVFDDLSSALDLHTEAELWRRLFDHRGAADPVTCLVVSHRPAALERADQILVVDGGRIVDRGRLDELLDRSPVMSELWEAGRN